MMTQYSPVTHTVNGSITDFLLRKKKVIKYLVYGNISVHYMYTTVIKIRTVKLCQISVVFL